MAKNLDLKQFLLHKGERLGLGVALVVMLLLIIFGGVVPWARSDSPSDTAQKIKKTADDIQEKIRTGAAESPAGIDDLLLQPLKNESVDVLQYAGVTPHFIETGLEDNKRNQPLILGPVEFDAQVARVQVMNYMVSMAGDKTRIGVLIPKDKKDDKGKDDLQKYLAQRGYGGKTPQQIPPQLMAIYDYQQKVKLWQQMMQQTQPMGEFTARPEWTLDFVESGKLPQGAKMAQAVHPYRMVIVSASFPWKQQLGAYSSALKKRLGDLEKEGLMPRFTKFAIQRRALDARGKVVENWTKIDLERDLLPVLSTAVGYSPLEANEAHLQPVTFDGLVIARPKLARGEYPKTDLKLLTKALQDYQAKLADNKAVMVAAPGERNLGTGQAINIYGGAAAVDDHGKGPLVPIHNKGPMGRDDGGKEEREFVVPEYCLVRFCDCTNIQPGLTYQYQIKIKAENPNYNKPENLLAFPGLAKEKEIESDWVPKEPKDCSVNVGVETFCYATELDDKTLDEKARRDPRLRNDKDVAFVQMHRWLERVRLNPENAASTLPVGDWTIADVPVRRGEYIGRSEQVRLPIWFPTRENFDFAVPIHTATRPTVIGAKPAPGPKGIPVSFSPAGGEPDMLVDFEGGKINQNFKLTEKTTKDVKEDAGVELLVMTADGRLRVLNSKADVNNPQRKERYTEWKKLIDDTENKVKKGGGVDDPFKIRPKN